MASRFFEKPGMLILIAALCLGLLGSSALAYWGVGAQRIGQADLRAGSVIGPRVLGGGPGTGK